jgi:hypothetical protein
VVVLLRRFGPNGRGAWMVSPTRVMYKLANVLTRWRERVGHSDRKLITRESRGQRCRRPYPHLSDVVERGYNNHVVGRGTITTIPGRAGGEDANG